MALSNIVTNLLNNWNHLVENGFSLSSFSMVFYEISKELSVEENSGLEIRNCEFS